MAFFFNIFALATTAVIAWLYLTDIDLSYFWILHILGGLVMGAWAAAVSVRLDFPVRTTFLFLCAVVFGGSLGWEVFEQILGLAGGPLDTVADFLFAAGGALVVFILYAQLRRRI